MEDVFELTKIDPWFLRQVRDGVLYEQALEKKTLATVSPAEMRRAKRDGLSDNRLARLWSTDPLAVRAKRKQMGVTAVFNRVDTCAAEFESFTPYLYSSYESECEAEPGGRKKVMIESEIPKWKRRPPTSAVKTGLSRDCRSEETPSASGN